MAALTQDNLAVFGGQGDALTQEGKASTAVFAKSYVMRDATGFLIPNANAAGVPVGLVDNGLTTTASPRFQQLERDSLFLATITGVGEADLGAPVFAPTDNPADFTKTFTAGANCVGYIAALEFNSLGAVANKCYVWLTDKSAGLGPALHAFNATQTIVMASAQTVAVCLYQCPANRRAIVLDGQITAQVANANYATSATFDLSKVVAAVRTSLLSGTVNVNTAGALTADTPFALTGAATPFVTLSKGDRLEGKVATVGAETTKGSLAVSCRIIEFGFAN